MEIFQRLSKSILNEKYTVSVCKSALKVVLNCMLLGEVGQGHRIVDLLCEHDLFEDAITRDTELVEFLHYAWAASDGWPTAYQASEDRHTQDEDIIVPSRASRLAKFKQERDKRFSSLLGKPNNDELTFDDFRKARKLVVQQRRGADALSVEIALSLGLHEVASEVMQEHLVGRLKTWDHTGGRTRSCSILGSPRLWELLCDGWLRKELDIKHGEVEDYVNDALKSLEKRLRHSPPAPLKRKSIPELCQIFDKRSLVTRRMGHVGPSYLEIEPEDDEDSLDEDEIMPATFLKSPAPEADIDRLEAKAKKIGFTDGLPEDLKFFLRTTNGIYRPRHEDDGSEIFCPASRMKVEHAYMTLELLPRAALGEGVETLISEDDWPSLEKINGIQLGAGGDEGLHILLPPYIVRQALDIFNRVYSATNSLDKQRLERAAKDIYGGIEEMRSLKCMVFRFYHWMAETEMFGTFKDLLVDFVADMVKDDVDALDNVANENADNNVEQAGGDRNGNVAVAVEADKPVDEARKRHLEIDTESVKRRKPGDE